MFFKAKTITKKSSGVMRLKQQISLLHGENAKLKEKNKQLVNEHLRCTSSECCFIHLCEGEGVGYEQVGEWVGG